MLYVELKFPFTGKTLPTDQGYAMYGAIARIVPEVHAADWFALETLPGVARGNGMTQLDPQGKLRMRLPQEHVALLLKLAGKQLHLNNQTIRLGAPQINLLQPSQALYARIVTIKGYTEPEPFTDAVCRKLNELGIRGEIVVGPRRTLVERTRAGGKLPRQIHVNRELVVRLNQLVDHNQLLRRCRIQQFVEPIERHAVFQKPDQPIRRVGAVGLNLPREVRCVRVIGGERSDRFDMRAASVKVPVGAPILVVLGARSFVRGLG